jgi:hypothetical protein
VIRRCDLRLVVQRWAVASRTGSQEFISKEQDTSQDGHPDTAKATGKIVKPKRNLSDAV